MTISVQRNKRKKLISTMGQCEEYNDLRKISGTWGYAAQRYYTDADIRVSLLCAMIQPSRPGHNFSARIFLESEDKPAGASAVGFGQIEGYSSLSISPQEIQFGTYDPSTSVANTFIQESVLVSKNSYYWVVITSQTGGWEIGYRNEPSTTAFVDESDSGYFPPHERGYTWAIESDKTLALGVNRMYV